MYRFLCRDVVERIHYYYIQNLLDVCSILELKEFHQTDIIILIHGVNVIKHRTPLRDQGIHDMSTVFIFQTMGKGGGGNGTSIKQATGWYQKYNCEMCQCNSFGIHMHAYAHL